MKRLSAQNLAEERPSRWVEMFFYRHPPVADRSTLRTPGIWRAAAAPR
jgi:hypothetical protein